MHTLREIHDNRYIATLTSKAGPSPSRQHRCTKLSAGGNGSYNVLIVSRDNESDPPLTIVGCISGIEGTRRIIKAHLALYCVPKFRFKVLNRGKAFVGVPWIGLRSIAKNEKR